MTCAGPDVAPALEARGLCKSYGSVEVLHNVDIAVQPGERYAIVGENGAGKSTLMRILSGALKQDAGEVLLSGRKLDAELHAARAAGIALVHQELSQVPDLSIAENVVLGAHPTRLGFINRKAMTALAREAIALVGLERDPGTLMRNLPFGERQLVEIGIALVRRPRVLVLDEPTSALSPVEVARLFKVLSGLAETTVLYVSHRLPEVYSLCDRASVLRDGSLIGTYSLANTPSSDLVTAMVGREVELLQRRVPVPAHELGGVTLNVEDIHGAGVNGISLQVRAGEVVGIGGLIGSGRTELLELLTGNAQITGGRIMLEGTPFRPRSPFAASRAGIAYVTEDRATSGLALELAVAANAVAPSIRRLSRWQWINRRRERACGDEVIQTSNVRPAQQNIAAGSLSGGNQQKLVLGKWLPNRPRLLVLDEPTKGVDVQAKSEIHRRIDLLAREGLAVLIVSSDLPELLTVSDRILVMRDGRISGEVDPAACDESQVIALASGSAAASRPPDGTEIAFDVRLGERS